MKMKYAIFIIMILFISECETNIKNKKSKKERIIALVGPQEKEEDNIFTTYSAPISSFSDYGKYSVGDKYEYKGFIWTIRKKYILDETGNFDLSRKRESAKTIKEAI
jgi:hypothetical protein